MNFKKAVIKLKEELLGILIGIVLLLISKPIGNSVDIFLGGLIGYLGAGAVLVHLFLIGNLGKKKNVEVVYLILFGAIGGALTGIALSCTGVSYSLCIPLSIAAGAILSFVGFKIKFDCSHL